MRQDKDGYPEGIRLRAVWDCCDDLYDKFGRVPTIQEFKDEIARREPERIGKSTHHRQRLEWMRYHKLSGSEYHKAGFIPEEYQYPQYLRVWYAVTQLKSAAARDIIQWINHSNAPLKATEIRIQLDAITVNSNSRYRYLGSRVSTRTDAAHPYDLLFRTGHRQQTLFEEYIPEKHGVWNIDSDGKKPIRVSVPGETNPLADEVRNEVFNEDSENYSDFRRRVIREIVSRQGQPVFRQRLFNAYGGKCAVTGCSIRVLLEAAHILPYAGAWHTEAKHGILMRSDIHTLFDRGLLWIDSGFKVRVDESLFGTEYFELDGGNLTLPERKSDQPLVEHLEAHLGMLIEKPGR